MSGDFPQFGNMIVTGNPCISNPTPQHWFNTAAFSPIPANTYVLRSNPLQYGCLTGPHFWNLDGNLTKSFNITERVHAELKIAAYNATNRLNRGDPDTDVHSPPRSARRCTRVLPAASSAHRGRPTATKAAGKRN